MPDPRGHARKSYQNPNRGASKRLSFFGSYLCEIRTTQKNQSTSKMDFLNSTIPSDRGPSALPLQNMASAPPGAPLDALAALYGRGLRLLRCF